MKKYRTVAQQVRDFGSRVTKAELLINDKITKLPGYYTYTGKNFTVNFNEDSCETTWWEVAILDDNVDENLYEYFEDYNSYERKKDLVFALLQLDKNWEYEIAELKNKDF